MINTANILLPANKLFPLGIVVVVLGGQSNYTALYLKLTLSLDRCSPRYPLFLQV
jgi:hypothetical protein